MIYYSEEVQRVNWGYKFVVTVHTRGTGWICSSLPAIQLKDNLLVANQTNIYASNYCSWTGINCNFQDVTSLVLKGYGIKGSIPSTIGLLQQLSQIDLSSNTFYGNVPTSIGGANMANLQIVDLSFNSFTGPIPVGLINSLYLSSLNLASNQFSGSIVNFISSQLMILRLDSNKFSGKVTGSLCRLMKNPLNGTFSAGSNSLLTCYEPCWQVLVNKYQIFDKSVIFCAPSSQPSSKPTKQPSQQPVNKPSCQPSFQPNEKPTIQPSIQPSNPSSQPSRNPSKKPSSNPSSQLTTLPTSKPSLKKASLSPTEIPSTYKPSKPTEVPSMRPSTIPTFAPSAKIKVNGDGCIFPNGITASCNLGYYCFGLLCYSCPPGQYCDDGKYSYFCPPDLVQPLGGMSLCVTPEPSFIPTVFPSNPTTAPVQQSPTIKPTAAILALGDQTCFNRFKNQTSCVGGQFCLKKKCRICPKNQYCPDGVYSYLCPPDLLANKGSLGCNIQKPIQSTLKSASKTTTDIIIVNIPYDEILVLENLYLSLMGDYWIVSDNEIQWDFTSTQNNPCTDNWIGISCIYVNNSTSSIYHITRIDLTSRNLIGTLPSLIANLSFLTHLNLRDNYIYNSLPVEFDLLTNLQYFDISTNLLSGAIPLLFGLKNLVFLDMSFNYLSEFSFLNRTTVSSLDYTVSLKYLNLCDNPLTGSLSNFRELVNLQYLRICQTFISGTIPLYSSLTKLEQLYLNNNNLVGTIPDFKTLLNLVILDFNGNFLNGSLTSFKSLFNLTSLIVNNNILSGSLPSFTSLSFLTYFDVSKNIFTGALSLIGNQSIIANIIIGSAKGDNKLVGPLPSQYCSYTKLELLSISLSNETCYPSCLYAFLNAEYINQAIRCPGNEDIAICDFVGSTNIGDVMNRKLQQESLTFDSPHPVPYLFKSNVIVNKPNVLYYRIQLDQRCFLPLSSSVRICTSINTCVSLFCKNQSSLSTNPLTIKSRSFNISFEMTTQGSFYGYKLIINAFISNNGWTCSSPPSIPMILSERKSLRSSLGFLQYNTYASSLCSWYGITCENGQIIGISLNSFNIKGTLSSSFSLIDTLKSLTLTSNSLRGTLPTSYSKFKNLQTLDLSSNFLNGTINEKILMMPSLITLSLAKNNFVGMISSNISSSLSTITLSNNALSGEIPSSIAKISSSVLFDFEGNPQITCYQPTFNVVDNPNLGVLKECVPTSSPTLFPLGSTSNGSGSSSSSIMIIAGSVGGAGLLIIIILGLIYFRYKSKYSSLGEQEKRRKTAIKERLAMLPIHKLLINEGERRRNISDSHKELLTIDSKEIIEVINSNLETIHELDFEENSIIDILMTYRDELGFDEVLTAAMKYFLPVTFNPTNNVIEQVDHIIHHFAWIKVVTSTLILKSVTEQILNDHPQLCESLANSVDEQGRTALQIAIPDCKDVIQQSLYFLRRYEITTIQPHHKSATCIIHLAIDHFGGQTQFVALKFMSKKNQFQSELKARNKGQFDSRYVMDILRCHDSDEDLTITTQLKLREMDNYPFILVMPMGNRDLDEIISKEFDSSDTQTTKLYISKIANCLAHLHSNGFIHGDLKPKNIMRVGGSLILIDLDASAIINVDFSGTKVSSGYLPPELIYHDIKSNQYKVKEYKDVNTCEYILDNKITSREFETETSISTTKNIDIQLYDYQCVLASAAHDIWSLGVLVYFLCTGQSFFYCDKAENIVDQESLKNLYEFTLDFKKKKLSIVSDPQARNLISQLLNKDPFKRLSLQQISYHPFLSGKTSIRMAGEDPEFDVFISYRVASDSDHARILFEKLTEANLKVWWDQKLLEFGKPWDEGFVEGLVKSRLFVPIYSRGAINHATNSRSNVTLLKEDSPVDNFLLEQRLALELKKRSMIELISPIMIGDFDKTTGMYSNYFGSGSHPNLSSVVNIVVNEVEKSVTSELDRLSLGLPMIDTCSVKDTIDAILKNQGSFLVGESNSGFDDIVNKIVKAMSVTANSTKA